MPVVDIPGPVSDCVSDFSKPEDGGPSWRVEASCDLTRLPEVDVRASYTRPWMSFSERSKRAMPEGELRGCRDAPGIMEAGTEHAGRSGLPRSEGPSKPRFDIKKPCDRMRCAAGRPDLRPHDLRQLFATLAIDQRRTLDEIGDTLGHRCAKTTRRYAVSFYARRAGSRTRPTIRYSIARGRHEGNVARVLPY